jgi:hypothetical protein
MRSELIIECQRAELHMQQLKSMITAQDRAHLHPGRSQAEALALPRSMWLRCWTRAIAGMGTETLHVERWIES